MRPPLPALQWQFPAEEPVLNWAGPFEVRHRLPSSAPERAPTTARAQLSFEEHLGGARAPERAILVVFRIDHVPRKGGHGAWQASLTQLTTEETSLDDLPSNAPRDTARAIQEAARLWAKCYLASAAPAHASLCNALGTGLSFDAFVARHFLVHHLTHCVDDLAQFALKAAMQDGDMLASDPFAQGRLMADVRGYLDELRVTLLGPGPDFIPDAQEQEMPAWDARLAGWLEQLGARSLAKDVRDRGREAASNGGPAFWAKWLPSDTRPPLRRLAFAALALWRLRVRPMLEREARSKPLRIEMVAHAGDSYTPVPKITAPVSWAFGAPGVPVKEVAGDRYAHEPSFIEDAALLPRSWRLLPEDHARRPHLTSLPVDEGQGDALPVAIAGSQGYVLSPYAAKLALLMLASPQVKAGEMAQSTLGDLTRMIRPDTKRLQARDHEATARGLDELHHLFVFLPNNTKVPVFQVQSPSRPELARPETVLHYGLTTLFSKTLVQAASGTMQGPGLQGREYSGQFLLNLTGTMRLPNNQPTLLRYYMRFAAHWNAAFVPGSGGEFDPSRMPARTIEDWAAIANALPPNVVEYLAAKGNEKHDLSNRRRRLSEERQRARADLESLAEDHKLIQLEKQGELIQPLPPPAYLEAWRLFRSGGGRPGDPGQGT